MYRANITVPIETYQAFRERCATDGTTMSAAMTALIVDWLHLPARPKPERQAPEYPPAAMSADDRAKRDKRIKELRGQGHSYKQIGEVVGLTESGVARRLKKYPTRRR